MKDSIIKEKVELFLLLIFAFFAILLISILNAVGILKVDDEYGF